MRLILLTVAMLAIATPTETKAQGAFGFRMGMTMEELKQVGTVHRRGPEGVYEVSTAPHPRDDMETYSVVYTPATGVCKAAAIGKDIDTSPYGTEVKSHFRDLRDAIAKKYGDPAGDFDFLQSGSIWNEDNDWMMGLKLDERHLASFWGTEDKPMAPNSDHVKTIELRANASDSHTGYVVVQFEFDNFNECRSALQQKQDDAF